LFLKVRLLLEDRALPSSPFGAERMVARVDGSPMSPEKLALASL